jgi:predicted MFS family arabinose efflux permease
VAIDRIGKGIRTAPRDGLIALRSPSDELATAFGVHRALDAAGAMIGPLAAFLLLAAAPGRFDILFSVSFVAAVAGLVIILLFVEPLTAGERGRTAEPRPAFGFADVLASPRFRAVLVAGALLGLPTISDAFVFLGLQRKTGIGATAFPLFYVATSLFTAAFSVPFGRLADRAGRATVLLFGYLLLAVVYVTLLIPGGTRELFVAFVSVALLGAYYAATDGVLTAMAAAVLPPAASGRGLSLLATVTNGARIAASVMFGLIWAQGGIAAATWIYLAALLAAIAAAAAVLRPASLPIPAGAPGE